MNITDRADFSFYDLHPKPANFYREVMDGLAETPKVIPPKFFYDETGSALFDAICNLPEYYLTRTEVDILTENAGEIAACVGPDCVVVEPGSGSSEKIRYLLDELRPHAYLPVDISRQHLIQAARLVASDYPWLDVHAACADFTQEIAVPYSPKGKRRIAFFPGSSVGNFDPLDALEFLRNIAEAVGPGGGLLIGVDLKKPPEILNAAYNDAAGVTARFNLNLLRRINRELNGNFDLRSFRHHAFYNENRGRIEMHLVSRYQQEVEVDGTAIDFAEGETIHTENSYKYTVDEFHALARRAGFVAQRTWTDPRHYFSVHYFLLAQA